MRILHMEDNPGWRDLVQELLSGHEVISVGNALEGLQLFEDTRPDLVIVDNGMPGMSGLQAVAALLAQGYPPSQILMFSASPFAGTKAMACGAKFLVKNDASQLATVVATMIVHAM
jgi:two-component system, NarL family, nitrate/nitrite response regulator NarL